MHNKILNFLLTLFLLTGCRVELRADATATPAPIIITATLPPTLTPYPTETPLPPLPSPTIVPVRGTTSTQLNVRAQPNTTSDVLGIIPANAEALIVGVDRGGNWWQILYEAGVDGKGWVTAQYVETATKPEVPVIGGDGTNPNDANSAVVIQQLNIRSGPGTSFNSLGILNVNDVVTLTGKNRAGTWLQIEFAAGPEGKGWINAGFVKANSVDVLPIVADSGEVVGTGTPMDTPLPPSPTLVPALMDFDSAEAPLASILFERNGTTSFLYRGDVSAPDGDVEDWIAFTSYDDVVYVSVQCSGGDSLIVEFTGGATLICDQSNAAITVQTGIKTLAHITAVSDSGSLAYTQYTLTIKVNH